MYWTYEKRIILYNVCAFVCVCVSDIVLYEIVKDKKGEMTVPVVRPAAGARTRAVRYYIRIQNSFCKGGRRINYVRMCT